MAKVNTRDLCEIVIIFILRFKSLFYGLAVKTGSIALQKFFFFKIILVKIFFSRFVSKNKMGQIGLRFLIFWHVLE